MRLGVTPWDFADLSAQSLTDQARAAESLGFDSFWLPENHFNPGAIPDPLMLLAAVAAGTRRIKLATTSYLLPLRHPLQAAEQVAGASARLIAQLIDKSLLTHYRAGQYEMHELLRALSPHRLGQLFLVGAPVRNVE